MCDFEILWVTNRALCREDFLARVEKLAASGAGGMILREKDLPEADYEALAGRVMEICRRQGMPCALHTYAGAASRLGAGWFHAPLPVLRGLSAQERQAYPRLSTSCHSLEDAREAVSLGCTHLIAGHIFPTACKAGLPGRGLDFLREVCGAVPAPVYAIGGIAPENIAAVRRAGAAGACIMSSAMTCPSPKDYIRELEEEYHGFQ